MLAINTSKKKPGGILDLPGAIGTFGPPGFDDYLGPMDYPTLVSSTSEKLVIELLSLYN
jgi:hypothetical protein